MSSISIEQIIQYVNYVLLAIIIICALIGLKRGTLKSGYYFVTTVISLVIGLILLGPISKAMLNINLTKYNITIMGIHFETPMQFITEYINQNFSDYKFLLQENSYSLELIQGVARLAINVVCYILLLIAMVTIFYLIFGILWQVFKKSIRKIFNKKHEPGTKYHISFLSRLGGLGIGATKGLIYLLLLGIIFAGISSAASSVENILSTTSEVAVVFVEDTYTVVELNTEEEIQNNEQNQIFDPEIEAILNAYRETIPGKVYGTLKIGKNKLSIDESLFDTIFKIKGKNGSIKICNELKTLEKAFANEAVKEVMKDGFDIKKLYLLSNQDLNNLVQTISSLDCIKVLVPVGLEFITYSDVLKNMVGSEYENIKELLENNLSDLMKVDYCQEIKHLGYAFVNVIDLLGDGLEDTSKIDYFNFDQEVLNRIFANLEKLEIIEIVAPITINYLLNSETVVNAIEKFGFTVEDLGFSKDIDYVKELQLIPQLYEKFVALGIKQVEGEFDLSNINRDAIDEFVDILFTSEIIENAIPIVASTLTLNYLPDEYIDLFTKEELEATNWHDEFAPLLKAVVILLNTDILTATDKIQTICSLSDKDIDDLGTYLSESNLVVSKLNYIMEKVLQVVISDKITYLGLDNTVEETWDKDEIISLFNIAKEFAQGFDFQFDDEEIDVLLNNMKKSKYIKKNLNNVVNALILTYLPSEYSDLFTEEDLKEIDWNDELTPLLNAVKIINSTDILNATDKVAALTSLSDEDIDNLGKYLSESKLIVSKLNYIIEKVLKTFISNNATYVGLDNTKEETWDKDEITSLFNVVKLLAKGFDSEFSDSEIETLADNVSKSKYIKKNLNNIVNSLTDSLGFEVLQLSDEEWNKNEIYVTFKAINIVTSSSKEADFSIEFFLNLSDENQNIILESKIIRNSMKNLIVEKSKDGEMLQILKGVYTDGKDDNGKILYSWDDEIVDAQCNKINNKLIITPVKNAKKYNIYKNDLYYASTVDLEFDINNNNTSDEYCVKAIVEYGELRNIVRSISLLEIEDVNNFNIDLRNVIKNKKEIFDSYIFTETVITEIRNLSSEESKIICIPEKYNENGNGEWKGENGELYNLLDAIDAVLEISLSSEPVYISSLNQKIKTLSFNNLNEQIDIVLKSDIISLTLVEKIREFDGKGINISEDYKTNNELWMSIYKNGILVEHKELGNLLNALTLVADLNLDKVDDFDIDLRNVINNKEELFLSNIFADTVISKIRNLSSEESKIICIPEKYNENGNGEWKGENGELYNLLDAIDAVLEISLSSEPVYISLLNEKIKAVHLSKLNEEVDVILKSDIISLTLIEKFRKLDGHGLNLSAEYENDEVWMSVYKNGKLVEHRELGKLLKSLTLVVKSDLDNIDDFTIDLRDIINNKEDIFASNIFADTVITEIRNLSSKESKIIYIPNEYNNDNEKWKGENGELNNLLDAIDAILAISSSSEPVYISSLNEKMEFLHLSNLSDNLENVLKSDIISLTLVNKFRKLNNQGLVIPEQYMKDDNIWMSEYKDGKFIRHQELGRLINSMTLITDQNECLEKLDAYQAMDDTLKLFIDDDNVKKVLQSEIACTTIKDYITNCDAFKNTEYIKTAFENNGRNIEDNDEWYCYDSNHEPIKKELWSLLKGISLIVGGASFKEVEKFNIELLIKNENLKPVFDEQCNVKQSTIKVILESIIIEEVFANIADGLCNGFLEKVINIPSDVKWYHKDIIDGEEHDLQTFLESFLIIQNYIGYQSGDVMNAYTSIVNLTQDEVKELATGMVTSRIFRSNIEKMFNSIFYPQYLIKLMSSPTIQPWDSVKFNQSDYENNTKVEARDKFIETFNKICAELKK